MANKRKRRKLDDAEVPLSAMIDIVFLLLVYFIVTQKEIIEDTLLGVDLPTPGGAKPEKPVTMFTIDVMLQHPENPALDLQTYHVNGRRWKFDDLKLQLIRTGETDPDQTIIINCGPNAMHRKLIQILDACAVAKLTKLNLVNDSSVKFNPDSFHGYYEFGVSSRRPLQ
jgi:biopolymer transport protein ExbD